MPIGAGKAMFGAGLPTSPDPAETDDRRSPLLADRVSLRLRRSAAGFRLMGNTVQLFYHEGHEEHEEKEE